MTKLESLVQAINQRFTKAVDTVIVANGEATLELAAAQLRDVCLALRDEDAFQFDVLIDVCGVDYLQHGVSEWLTDDATAQGFSRAVAPAAEFVATDKWQKPRFAAVYHLLSLTHNHRIRLRVFCDEADMLIDTVSDIWNSALWFEREAFDLFGILFKNHPDLRRILTDYGFIGHPFRKDFPVSGHVEMRYDAKLARVVYEPVDIVPRVLVPKVIRHDNRYSGVAK